MALQALAAVLGGTQSLHCNGRDEALGLPTEESAQLALRTQQIMVAETGVTNTVDPVGGAYAIERLTDDIERDALDLIEKIDAQGGILHAIEAGTIQREIQDAAYQAQQAVDRGEEIVVGVNRFVTDQGAHIDALQIDPTIEPCQRDQVRALRAGRDPARWRAALDQVSTAAREEVNLVPPILAAVEAHATVGEIADALRDVFGQHRETRD